MPSGRLPSELEKLIQHGNTKKLNFLEWLLEAGSKKKLVNPH